MKLKRETINTLEEADFLDIIENFTKWYEDRTMGINAKLFSAFVNLVNENGYDFEEVIVRAIQINQGYYHTNLTTEVEIEFE